MRMRGLGLALLVGAMMPGTSWAQATPVPDVLKSYGKDGTFDPGDFGWMAGRFAAEGAAARAAWQSVAAYKEACIAAATGKAKAELAMIGAESTNLPPGPYGDEACRAITAAMAIDAGSEAERAALPARLAEARQLWNFALAGGRMGIGAVTSAVGPPESEDAQMLIGATFREQLGRHMLSWGVDEGDPPLPARLKPLFDYLGWTMIAGEDRKNREKLRAYMAEKGWPTISALGEKASHAAWLLAQHADDDPALQVRALRLMEPLAKAGEASKSNYAYLYDRVMLKLAGRQRYATQFGGCEAGRAIRPLRPMEDDDPAHIDAARAEMGLEPLAVYRKEMDEAFGACAAAE
ncbi:DUF6624 domain-containing protein [Sphingopyxis sp. GW247-27LB]|uniref:DUF6624 domain-containing protein n=1 Tax=Sphingopyxis sp. GW247-27LB TaxID=2012632 RepID=UPI001140F014|nr:DUF6624 domain-containing protein [Sphingopyxis sp. GW247-27LB]